MSEGSLEAPVRHPVDWQNPDFYDEEKLEAELRRVFDICHGCRRCFNLCDSFPRLFDLVDASPSGELHDVQSSDFKSVVDACTLCDMCFLTKCPYVPPHEFNLDFPHLMLRYRAAAAKNGKMPLADRELAKTDRNGEAAKYIAPLANWATHNSAMRGLLETVAGVHREAELPRYAPEPLTARAQKESVPVNTLAPAYGQRKAVLYATCSMNYNDPGLGWLTRRVLAKLGVETEIVYPACCGMPQLEQGQIAEVVANARIVALAMQDWIAKGYDIVALVPSCALMLKQEWPLLVPEGDPVRPAVDALAKATFDLTEFVVDIAKKNGLAPGLSPLAGPVAVHLACHARAQNMGAKAADMLRLLPQPEGITVIERCSGHGGTWGVKKDNFETALKVGKTATRKAAEVLEAAAEKNQQGFVASECPLAAAHLVQGISRLPGSESLPPARPYHPIEIFALSYGLMRDAQ
jgi:glycerol-3-phosphate dehydrogenase subunit C